MRPFSSQGCYGWYDGTTHITWVPHCYGGMVATIAGGIKLLNPGRLQPACDANHRFTMWAILAPNAESADHVQMLLQDSTGTPKWVQIY